MLKAIKTYFLVLASIIILNVPKDCFCDDAWELVSGIKDSGLKEVSVGNGKGVVYVAGEKDLYQTEDSGASWTIAFSSQLNGNNINFIRVIGQRVFICAKNGAFASDDAKSGWNKVFSGIGDKENNVSHIAFSKDNTIYVATDGGLFISKDSGVTWLKDFTEKSGSGVRWVELLNGTAFIATQKGVYRNSGAGWKRTFVTAREGVEYDADIADESLQAIKPVNSVSVNKDKVFLATDSGIFISEDNGETWDSFINTGLASLRVKRVLCRDDLYAITDKGVFVFSDKNKLWRSLYKGMATKEANSMAIDSEGNMWVATRKGLYINRLRAIVPLSSTAPADNKADVLALFNYEPGISDVQEAAINYAEVHPDKIKKWRDAAGKKALLPNVSIGVDRYVTDYWHWDSGTSPDTLQKGKDAVVWDVTMSWDLGDCLWNSDQTSIDTRSKLMVELRDDILNEVTRTYFERRRVQIELVTTPPKDLKLSLEKELRLQELTADIDALTGGYFSRKLKE